MVGLGRTLRVIVAPDSTSPNLKKPVHIEVSVLKNPSKPFSPDSTQNSY